MKILGLVFGIVDSEQKLNKSLSLWKSRSLSVLEKAFVGNVLRPNKLIYLARVLVLPAWIHLRVNRIGICDLSFGILVWKLSVVYT